MYLRRTTFGLLATLLAASLAVVVAWAGYTGPNRTTTKRVRDYAHDVWTCTRSGQSCEFEEGHPDCRNHPSTGSQQSACGWVATNCGCEKAYKEKTTSQPPATVSGSFNCSDSGEDGWCRNGASLALSASEPLGGEVIQVIEGEPGGVLCDPSDADSVECTWSDGGQGDFTVEYWAVSSFGDTSAKASSAWKLDSEAPEVELSVSGGEEGGGGWYRGGAVSVSASGSDATSGVSSAEVSLEGGSWQGSLEIDEDGVFDVHARATDRAGNSAETTDRVKFDSSSPSVDGSFSGTKGENGWYVSSVSAKADGSDGLSGVDQVQVRIDGGDWQDSPAEITGDGTHVAEFRASDVAGNQAGSSESTVRIDTTRPHSSFQTPSEGSESWISGQFTFEGESSDSTSGLAGIQLSLDGGGSWRDLGGSSGWSYRWDTRSVPNGTYTILARANDLAGNRESTARVTVKVDNLAPVVEIPDRWTLGDTAPLKVTERDIGLDGVEVKITSSGATMASESFEPQAVPGTIEWDGLAPDGQPAAAGEYTVTAVAWDRAGNRGSDTGIVIIPVAAAPDQPLPDQPLPDQPLPNQPLPDQSLPGQPEVPAQPELPGILDIFRPRPQPAASVDSAAGAGGPPPGLASSTSEAQAQAVDFRRIWIWPAFAWAGLLAAVGYAKLSDRRPDALRRLRADLRRIRKLQS